MYFQGLFITSIISGALASANIDKRDGKFSRAVGPASSLDKAIDPTNKYSLCRLSQAQSARVGDRFYTVGGETWFTSAGLNDAPFNGTNTRIFWFDLSKSFSLQNYEVDSANKPIGPPDGIETLEGASLFSNANGSTLTQFGGAFAGPNNTDPGALQNFYLAESVGIQNGYHQVSTFDLETYNWNGSQAFVNNDKKLEQPSAGASVSTPAGDGYYLNGHLPFLGLVIPSPGLIIYNGTDGSYTNETTSFGTRIRGNLVHVPVGKQGILMSFAGEAYSHNDQQGETDSGKALVDMNTIKIYDIDSHSWYDQLTTSDSNANNSSTGVTGAGFPAGRVRPCSVVAAASDGSSYNIYMFGGTDHDNEEPSAARTPYSQVWVLSIPSFKWILVDSGNCPLSTYRVPLYTFSIFSSHGYNDVELTCDVAGNKALYSMTCTIDGNQAFLLSGSTTIKTGGQGNCTDAFSVFDLSALKWSTNFTAQTNYAVPSMISQAIGGGANGGATSKSPANGWSDPALATIFDLRSSTSTSNNTTPTSGSTTTTSNSPNSQANSSTKSHTNLIVGLTVGGIVFLAICLLLFRYHRQRMFKGNKRFRENGDIATDSYGYAEAPNTNFQKQAYHGSEAELGGNVVHEAPSNSPNHPEYHEVPGDHVPIITGRPVYEAP